MPEERDSGVLGLGEGLLQAPGHLGSTGQLGSSGQSSGQSGNSGQLGTNGQLISTGQLGYTGQSKVRSPPRANGLSPVPGVPGALGVPGVPGALRVPEALGVYGAQEEEQLDVFRQKPVRLTVKVKVPVAEHPKFNFVGKLLGPKGSSLKRLQEKTRTRMAIFGTGSCRSRQKEEELLATGDPKFCHLREPLHLQISALAPPAEAHLRIATALTEVRPYLIPDSNDLIRQRQRLELSECQSPPSCLCKHSRETSRSPEAAKPEVYSRGPESCTKSSPSTHLLDSY